MDLPHVAKYRGLISAKPHRQELIQDLYEVIQYLQRGAVNAGMLISFKRSTWHMPSRIIFYRVTLLIFRSKCHKNFKMKRNPRKVKWTKAYRKLHGKDMTQDSTFEFERKRNRPERYDRNLTENTLKAIKKIDKVKVAREAAHIGNRMRGNKNKKIAEARKELDNSIHLVKAPIAMREDPSLTLPQKIKVQVSQPAAQENRAMEE